MLPCRRQTRGLGADPVGYGSFFVRYPANVEALLRTWLCAAVWPSRKRKSRRRRNEPGFLLFQNRRGWALFTDRSCLIDYFEVGLHWTRFGNRSHSHSAFCLSAP